MLQYDDRRGLAERLACHRVAAEEAGCDTVLLSNSAIWRALLSSGEEALLGSADRAGFGGVEALVLLRDPIEHAVSHYRQVVKVGRAVGPFSRWLEDHVYIDGLGDLLTRSSAIRWTVHRYDPARVSLDVQVLTGWLGLEERRPTPHPEGSALARSRVNSSLTADEALCIVDLGAGIPGIHEALAPRFLSLPVADRPTDTPADARMRAQATEYCRQLAESIHAVNALLPREERFDLAGHVDPGSVGSPGYSLTPAQEVSVNEGREAHLREYGTRWRRYGFVTGLRKWLVDRAPRPVRWAYRMVLRPFRRRRA